MEKKAAQGLSFSLVDHLRWDLRAIFRLAAEDTRPENRFRRQAFGSLVEQICRESNIWILRDYQVNEKHSIFGRFVFDYVHQTHPFQFTPNNILNTSGKSYDNLAASYTFGSIYLMFPLI